MMDSILHNAIITIEATMTRRQVIDNVNGLVMDMRQQHLKSTFIVTIPDVYKDDETLKSELLDMDKVVEVYYREGNTCSIVEKTQ